MYKLCFYVPPSHLEAVKNAVFSAGAGQVGHYSHCAWQVLGTGQFLPNAQASPFIGVPHEMTTLPEWKVEIVFPKEHLQPVIQALKAAHPYEEPAYEVVTLVDI